MFRTITISSLLLLVGIAAVAEANHSWGGYHWDLSTADTTADPLMLGDNVSSVWDAHLAVASDDWNQSVIKNEVVPGSGNADCAPVRGQVEVCSDSYGTTGWLGIAQIWTYRGKNRDHIAQAITKLNDTYFDTATYDTPAWRNLVMCQEVGHTFGLGHQDESFSNANLGTCMDYTSDPDGSLLDQANNEHPNQHDYDMLAEIYAHLNGTQDGGDGGDGGSGKPDKCDPWPFCKNGSNVPSEVLDGPAEWGQAIAQDGQGRDSLYVRSINGFEIFTHVLWTPE